MNELPGGKSAIYKTNHMIRFSQVNTGEIDRDSSVIDSTLLLRSRINIKPIRKIKLKSSYHHGKGILINRTEEDK